jgi:hypothetical protein
MNRSLKSNNAPEYLLEKDAKEAITTMYSVAVYAFAHSGTGAEGNLH